MLSAALRSDPSWAPIDRFKVELGMKMIVKPIEWYNYWIEELGIDDGEIEGVRCVFVQGMSQYCGKVVTIKDYKGENFSIEEDGGKYFWSVDCFSDVYRNMYDVE